MSAYRRLSPFLRPHAWRMVVSITANVVAALLDGFSIALLIPFLNILFHQPAIGMTKGFVAKILTATVGSSIVPGHDMDSLRNVIELVLAQALAKNILDW